MNWFIIFFKSSDTCVLESFGEVDSIDQRIIVKSFVPFDPTNKRTEVTYEEKSTGAIHRVTKGMPEVILGLCLASQSETLEKADRVRADVKEFARRGFRALAIAIAQKEESFRLIGMLPIFDPPREDTADTIRNAIELGSEIEFFSLKKRLFT